MATDKEFTARTRALKILKTLVEAPFFYTKKQLAKNNGVSTDTIDRDFEAIKTVGFSVEPDENHRYGLAFDRAFDALKSLLVFSKKEEDLLMSALHNLKADERDVQKLKDKFSRIYDISKMHNIFDKHFLSKMDKLEKACKEKKVVILRGYHSTNSNSIKDRTIEPYQIGAEQDIVHAFDHESKEVRHYRISRISTLDITTKSWQYEKRHYVQATDPFRIHDNQHVRVHIRMEVGGYNALLESFPITRGHLNPVLDMPDHYDLVCKVNHKFMGLTNFIMGNYHSIVAIYEPDELIEHVKIEAQKLLAKKF